MILLFQLGGKTRSFKLGFINDNFENIGIKHEITECFENGVDFRGPLIRI